MIHEDSTDITGDEEGPPPPLTPEASLAPAGGLINPNTLAMSFPVGFHLKPPGMPGFGTPGFPEPPVKQAAQGTPAALFESEAVSAGDEASHPPVEEGPPIEEEEPAPSARAAVDASQIGAEQPPASEQVHLF